MDRPLHGLPPLLGEVADQLPALQQVASGMAGSFSCLHNVHFLSLDEAKRFWRQTPHCPIPMEDVHKLVKVVGSMQESEAPFLGTACQLLPDDDPFTEARGSLEEQEGLTRACGKPRALAVKVPDCPLEQTC